MKIQREVLLRSLESVTPGLSPREILEQSNALVFRDGRVQTFNDEVSVSVATPLRIEGAVVAEPLLALLRKLTEAEVDVDVVDGELTVKGERRRAGIRMERDITLPVEGIEAPGEWRKLHGEFLEAVGIVGQCCSRDESHFVLTCVNLAPDWVEASDDYQLCRYPLATGLARPTLIRRSALRSVVATDMTEFSETENWLHFRNPTGLQISCRRYVDDYPSDKIGEIMEFEGVRTELPKGLDEAVDKAEIFSSDGADTNQVNVELRQGKMKLTGRGENGWFSQFLPARYAGEEIRFTISPKLLLEISKRSAECLVGTGRLRIDGGKFTYVSCLGAVEG